VRRVPALVAASAPLPPPVAVAIALVLLTGACSAVVSSSLVTPDTSPVPSAALDTPLPRAGVANGWIAVAANRMEEGDIYLVSGGVPARPIIGSVGDGIAQACPKFSPDGRRLAYGVGRPARQAGDDSLRGRASVADRGVVVVALDDRGDPSPPVMRVTPSAGSGPVPCPEWSPDGGSVAFRIGTQLWVADARSGTSRAFQAADATWGQRGLAWSRDGSRIAVAESGLIRIVSLDGGPSTVIPVTGATPASLGWAAGDDEIVYLATDGPGDGLDLRVIDVRDQADKRLTPDPIAPRVTFDPGLGALVSITRYVEAAAVSPDGTRVALAYHDSRCTSDGCSTDPEHLLTMDLSGGHVVEVPIPTDFGTPGLEWSPDGTRLLLGSIAGLVSVPVTAGSPAVVHSRGELDFEWSGSEITWQPVYP
jgi:WD40 repeat protein